MRKSSGKEKRHNPSPTTSPHLPTSSLTRSPSYPFSLSPSSVAVLSRRICEGYRSDGAEVLVVLSIVVLLLLLVFPMPCSGDLAGSGALGENPAASW